MNRVAVSLLKGSLENKISLLPNIKTVNDIEKLFNSGELKSKYNLEKGYHYKRLDEIESYITASSVKTVCITDIKYPSLLKEIYDPPFLLYVLGNVDTLNEPSVSVVGSRKASVRGLHESFRLGLDLGKEDVSVCSGLALGIDSAAQSGNVTSGGKSIAVLGSGVDTIYPKSNRSLAVDLLKNCGAIVSEFPPGESPKAYNFPKRNRIIAGLSRQLVVIQAPDKSGSLITTDFALQNGCDIYIHSAGIGDKRFLGSDRLYKDGGTKIDSASPLLKNMGIKHIPYNFSSDDYSSNDLLKLELDGKIIKYKGEYFSL